MIFDAAPPADVGRAEVSRAYRADETEIVNRLLDRAEVVTAQWHAIEARARGLIEAVRRTRAGEGGLDAFLQEYGLDTAEGVVLLCLAEALLRIPDAETQDRLIRDKMVGADWAKHVGHSDSVLVNASTWAMMLTGRILRWEDAAAGALEGVLARVVARGGEPVIRQGVREAIRILGRQFVMGRTIEEALARAADDENRAYRHSFDMLGEAARTAADSARYYSSYEHAIAAIGAASRGRDHIDSPGISIKLSALHPRFEFAQRERVMAELVPRVLALITAARRHAIGVTIDAEEADRLDITLDVLIAAAESAELHGWDGLGIVVQAYQKRALPAIEWLGGTARRLRRRWMLRLVKGAYWDTEIKRAQERGLDGFPVFTRKAATDLSYMACAKALLESGDAFYPQFATHNALTVAFVLEHSRGEFEFQRLHGMGGALYREIVEQRRIPCRIYAPVGSHEDLLPYLVRRLLENGANSSFVNRIADDALPIEALLEDPAARLRGKKRIPNPRIALPRALYGDERRNSLGLDLSDPVVLTPLAEAMRAAAQRPWRAGPIVAGEERDRAGGSVTGPADRRRVIGHVVQASAADVERALAGAHRAFAAWDGRPADERATILEQAADLLEADRALLMALCVREAGKTIADAQGEVREAADFCRYYAARAREFMGAPRLLPGPTGERNTWSMAGRGVFASISPGTFPLAIFTGQIAAGLAAGNCVVAKPAEQTPLTAAAVVRLFHRAGIPGDALQLLPGPGAEIGGRLVADARIAGVVFTGSTETAWAIQRALADRRGPIIPFIAETGGQNAMIVDSSALPEQVVGDAVQSAFSSAGQRCSALRILCLQDEIADKTIAMLAGAMAEQRVGDPALLETDVGPVIDEEAKAGLVAHVARMTREARLIAAAPLPDDAEAGVYLAPHAFELERVGQLEREVFGPILHVVRFAGDRLEQLVDAINATGYGLTLGVHSRIDSTAELIHARARAGNVYVNRGMIGAVVGVQPFGGEGLSGTGPKAGGPL